MFLIRSRYLLFIILFVYLNYSWVSSSYPDETVFQSLLCQKGFHLPSPNSQSKIGGALYSCINTYSNFELDKSMDCISFCMAQAIKMFVYSGSRVVFNKTNLMVALSEWFGGAGGPQTVKVIANDFEKCVKQHSQILLNYPSCELNGDLKSDQTELWKCFQDVLPPCEPEIQNKNGNGASKSNSHKNVKHISYEI